MGTVRDALQLPDMRRIELGYGMSITGELAGTVALVVYALSAAGLYFVWFPEQTTMIAHVVGVGRGADLLFYCWLLASLIVMFNLHIKANEQLRMLTDLARALALGGPASQACNSVYRSAPRQCESIPPHRPRRGKSCWNQVRGRCWPLPRRSH